MDSWEHQEVITNYVSFYDVAEKSNGESVMLCAASDEERKEWMKALCYHIYAGKGGGRFDQMDKSTRPCTCIPACNCDPENNLLFQ